MLSHHTEEYNREKAKGYLVNIDSGFGRRLEEGACELLSEGFAFILCNLAILFQVAFASNKNQRNL